MTETRKRKTGPKVESGISDLKPVTLMLDPHTRRLLKVAGVDNESRGVRAAARHWFEQYQAGRVQPVGDENPVRGPTGGPIPEVPR